MPAYPGSEPDEPQIEVSAAPGQAVDILRVTSADRGVTLARVSKDGQVYSYPSWEDLRFPASSINPAGSPSPPAQDTADPFAGTLLFDTAGTDVIAGIAQMPHSWRRGSEVRPHIHWAPTSTGAGNVAWRFSYSVASINDTFAESLTTAGIEVDAADGVSGKHQVHGFTAIDMTAHRESCILIWKLERVGGDDADTYAADARLLELDFHFQAEKAGTFTEIPV